MEGVGEGDWSTGEQCCDVAKKMGFEMVVIEHHIESIERANSYKLFFKNYDHCINEAGNLSRCG